MQNMERSEAKDALNSLRDIYSRKAASSDAVDNTYAELKDLKSQFISAIDTEPTFLAAPEDVATLINLRITMNLWLFATHHERNMVDKALSSAFYRHRDLVTADAVALHVEKALSDDPDWAAHLAIANTMLKSGARLLTESQSARLQAMAAEPVAPGDHGIRQQHMTRFVQAQKCRPRYALSPPKPMGIC